MRANRVARNAHELNYQLLGMIHDRGCMRESEIKNHIHCLYSTNYNTTRNHLNLLTNSGFIKIIKIGREKWYQFSRNEE